MAMGQDGLLWFRIKMPHLDEQSGKLLAGQTFANLQELLMKEKGGIHEEGGKGKEWIASEDVIIQ